LAGTAFAPAPLPKKPQRVDPSAVSLANVQGDWRVVSFEEVIGPNDLRQSVKWFTGVRIKGEHLTYRNDQGDVHRPIQIAIDGDKRPATIDFFQGSTDPCFVGIVRRQGNRFTILYYHTTRDRRATSFENVPLHWWVLELER